LKELYQPLTIRICHWVMALSVVILTLTGLHMSQPFSWLGVKMSSVRKLHYTFGFISLFNLLFHLSFYAITKTYGDILIRWGNLKDIPSFAKYFLFISEPHPNFGRYNPGQRLIFCSWGVTLLVGAITGLISYFPHETTVVDRVLGGPQGIRVIKYFIAAYFAATMPIHLYLVFSEDPAKLQAMFTGYVRKTKIPKISSAKE